MTSRTPKPLLACVLPLFAVAALAGCGTVPAPAGGGQDPSGAPSVGTPAPGKSNGPTTGPSSKPTAAPPAPKVEFSANIADGAKAVKVDTLVTAKAANGKLSKVTMSWKGPDSKGVMQSGKVAGSIGANGSWTAGGRLEPGAKYTLDLTGAATGGSAVTKKLTFHTQKLTLAQQTFPELYPLRGSEVGVGMPVVLRFDVGVKDKKTFEKHLSVASSPKQEGSWRWYSDREVHFRPKNFWKSGTKISVKADLNGLSAGNGVYGQRSTSTDFTIGRSVVTKINLVSHKARVYINGDLKRTIPISAGKSGWSTRSGTKLIVDKLYKTRMTNEMIGARENYDLQVYYAMRITNSGEFIHAAPWNSGNMGRVNASHGCVGMNTGDASWLFSKVKVGDPVITTGSSRGLEPGNGYTDWNASYASYKKGSAL